MLEDVPREEQRGAEDSVMPKPEQKHEVPLGRRLVRDDEESCAPRVEVKKGAETLEDVVVPGTLAKLRLPADTGAAEAGFSSPSSTPLSKSGGSSEGAISRGHPPRHSSRMKRPKLPTAEEQGEEKDKLNMLEPQQLDEGAASAARRSSTLRARACFTKFLGKEIERRTALDPEYKPPKEGPAGPGVDEFFEELWTETEGEESRSEAGSSGSSSSDEDRRREQSICEFEVSTRRFNGVLSEQMENDYTLLAEVEPHILITQDDDVARMYATAGLQKVSPEIQTGGHKPGTEMAALQEHVLHWMACGANNIPLCVFLPNSAGVTKCELRWFLAKLDTKKVRRDCEEQVPRKNKTLLTKKNELLVYTETEFTEPDASFFAHFAARSGAETRLMKYSRWMVQGPDEPRNGENGTAPGRTGASARLPPPTAQPSAAATTFRAASTPPSRLPRFTFAESYFPPLLDVVGGEDVEAGGEDAGSGGFDGEGEANHNSTTGCKMKRTAAADGVHHNDGDEETAERSATSSATNIRTRAPKLRSSCSSLEKNNKPADDPFALLRPSCWRSRNEFEPKEVGKPEPGARSDWGFADGEGADMKEIEQAEKRGVLALPMQPCALRRVALEHDPQYRPFANAFEFVRLCGAGGVGEMRWWDAKRLTTLRQNLKEQCSLPAAERGSGPAAAPARKGRNRECSHLHQRSCHEDLGFLRSASRQERQHLPDQILSLEPAVSVLLDSAKMYCALRFGRCLFRLRRSIMLLHLTQLRAGARHLVMDEARFKKKIRKDALLENALDVCDLDVCKLLGDEEAEFLGPDGLMRLCRLAKQPEHQTSSAASSTADQKNFWVSPSSIYPVLLRVEVARREGDVLREKSQLVQERALRKVDAASSSLCSPEPPESEGEESERAEVVTDHRLRLEATRPIVTDDQLRKCPAVQASITFWTMRGTAP
eukprot:g12420.t1